MAEVIPYSRALKIVNLDALASGTGARFLVVIRGENGALIAKRWARKLPADGLVVSFS